MRYIARRRLRLWCQDPHCHWCGVETLIPPVGYSPKRDNDATLDHLFERLIDGKRDTSFSGQRTVLACRKCNNRRGVQHGHMLDAMRGKDKCRRNAQLGHLIKRACSWVNVVSYQPLDLGKVMDMGAA
jgi:hypothetical protein